MDYLKAIQDLTFLLIEKTIFLMKKNKHSKHFIRLLHEQVTDFAIVVKEISETQSTSITLQKAYKTQKIRHGLIVKAYAKCLKHCFSNTESKNLFVDFMNEWTTKRTEIQVNYYKSLERM